jgi:hypothetical protein
LNNSSRFREFLAVDGSTAELDFWTDAQYLTQATDQLRLSGLAFRGTSSLNTYTFPIDSEQSLDLYVSSSGDAHVPLSAEVRRELLGALQHIVAADASFSDTQTHLLESMYNEQFQVAVPVLLFSSKLRYIAAVH